MELPVFQGLNLAKQCIGAGLKHPLDAFDGSTPGGSGTSSPSVITSSITQRLDVLSEGIQNLAEQLRGHSDSGSILLW